MVYRPDVCIYHGGCMDGFTAAWCVFREYPDTLFIPAIYNQLPPTELRDAHVLIVDFSYKKPVLLEMAKRAASITVLDHHKTSAADLEEFAIFNPVSRLNINEIVATTQPGLGNIRAVFDMNKSGARLTQEFMGLPQSRLIDYVEDRDLWRHLLPRSKEVNAYLQSWDFTFDNWFALQRKMSARYHELADQGASILRKQQKDIADAVASTRRTMTIGGWVAPVANLPYVWASEGAHILAKETGTFGVCYLDRADGKRQFSLRSVGDFDVSEIAKAYGGGGHRNAAGFEAVGGWEGDTP